MTPHHIVVICIRLVAIALLLYTLSHLHELFAFMNDDAQVKLNKTAVWTFALIQVGVSGILWFFPRTIASKLLPTRDSHQAAPAARLMDWQTLVVVGIGLWVTVRGVFDAIYWAAIYNMMKSPRVGIADFSPQHKAAMIVTAVELAIGIWLLLGAKGIAAVLFRLRSAGERE